MAKVVILRSGFAGHTAAMYLGSRLGKEHRFTVMSNNDMFSYIPIFLKRFLGITGSDGRFRPA